MAEQIRDGRGESYALVVNPDGSINTVTSGINISIGSLALSLEEIYVTSGNFFMVSGNAWNGVGSVVISGVPIIIGSVAITNQYLGSKSWVVDTIPISQDRNNPAWGLSYDANGYLDSIVQFIDTGSYVNTLTWQGFSGTSLGIGSRISNIGSWS